MKIRIEVTKAELEERNCDSIAQFKEAIRHQIDEGVVTDDGGVGEDWMVEYDLDVTVI